MQNVSNASCFESDAVSKMLYRLVAKASIKKLNKTRFADDKSRSFQKRRSLDMHSVKSEVDNINIGVALC